MNDFVIGIIIGIGLCSWFTAMWIWFLTNTKFGWCLIGKYKKRFGKKI